jgi:hypothetical protein
MGRRIAYWRRFLSIAADLTDADLAAIAKLRRETIAAGKAL